MCGSARPSSGLSTGEAGTGFATEPRILGLAAGLAGAAGAGAFLAVLFAAGAALGGGPGGGFGLPGGLLGQEGVLGLSGPDQ